MLVTCSVYIGYCMVAKRYEFYNRVARTIYCSCHENKNSYLWANVWCSFCYINILMTAFLTISRRSPKILQNCSEGQTNVPEHFRKFPKISEHCRRLSRKTRRCFDHTSTNLNTIQETNLISVKSSRSSLVRIWKIRHSSHGCSFVWIILRVVYFPVKHSCLYNKMLTRSLC